MKFKIRFLIIPIAFLLFFTNAGAQILHPVKWTSHVEKISDTEFNLVIDAKIEEGWHVYSQFTPDGGPIPITIDYKNKGKDYDLVGKTIESPYKKSFDDGFGIDVYIFENQFTLKQKIKIKNPATAKIDAQLDYQVCRTQCINDHYNFTFEIPKITARAASSPVNSVEKPVVKDSATAITAAVDTAKTKISGVVKPLPVTKEKKEGKRGLWTIFILSFLGGFAALLTPCVFPMIPMTVSFFTKRSKTRASGIRNAFVYGISIILIYVVLGLIVNSIFGADALNSLATNVWFNLLFFVILVVFAASFLGAFEIMLPNSWANKVDRQADRGGIIGILFMALALAIVSFSCTGPIVGTLLVESASKGGIAPVVGMFGFSLAIALPFMLFAMFPGWLNTLPKSGGWLNTVKVFLGFLELAFAFKFLSNADLVMQWHFLEREAFLSIWIAVFGILALYLFGKITMPHDSPMQSISVGRTMLGLLVLSFTIYLVPGLWGAPLKLISAFPPPMDYSESPFGLGGSAQIPGAALPEGAKYGPQNIVAFEDYDVAMAYAKKVNKPLFLDYTGRACANCRLMENNVWSKEEVLKILKNDVVLVSLYGDEQTLLPKEKQFKTKEGDEIKTVGDKWSYFFITKYKTNTQPYYVLEDHDGKALNPKHFFKSVSSADDYLAWLKAGIADFKK